MRQIFLIISILPVLIFSQEISLKGEWEYRVGDSGPWKSCSLPNTIENITGGLVPLDYVRFKKKIDVPLEILDKNSLRLNISNLDTYCTILINDDQIMQSRNFFIPIDLEIKEYLFPGENEFVLEFTPSLWFMEKEWKKDGLSFPEKRQQLEVEMHERKPRYMHSGSNHTNFGVYGDMKLQASEHIKVKEANFKLISLTEEGRAKILIKLRADVMETGSFKFESKFFTQEEKVMTGSDRDIFWTFFVDDFKYWFPRGLGEQNSIKELMKISYRGLKSRDYELDTDFDFQINFNQLELIQNPKNEEEFSFEIEGMEIPIIATTFTNKYLVDEIGQRKYYEDFIQKVLQTDVNLINIQGEGGYPRDSFFKLCDSLGLMVWQDFAFAGMGFPSDSLLYKNARKEVNYEMRRISKYASFVLFSGSEFIEKNYTDESLMTKYSLEKKDIKALKKGQNDLFGRIFPIALTKFNSRVQYKRHSPDFKSGNTDFSFGKLVLIDN